MTYAEFLAKLRETPRTWGFDAIGCIRSRECCPITKVHGQNWIAECALDSARFLRLPRATARRIIAAADAYQGYSRQTRRDLLDACGLTESR